MFLNGANTYTKCVANQATLPQTLLLLTSMYNHAFSSSIMRLIIILLFAAELYSIVPFFGVVFLCFFVNEFDSYMSFVSAGALVF